MTTKKYLLSSEQGYLVYNRRSTDDALNQRNSLMYQRQRNLEYANREGISIADLTVPGFCKNGIIDESHSGFKEEDEFVLGSDGSVTYRILRPKFAQLVEMLKEKRVKGVVFLCWHRASRNKQDDVLIKKLRRLGSDLRFSEADYDEGSVGEMRMDMDGMLAAYYSRVISDGVANAYGKLRAEGFCVYLSPIGYLDDGPTNKPLDPVRAPIVKRIFELYSTGEWSLQNLADWANGQGLTKKPRRRNRTKAEIADNVEVDSMPSAARPVDRKTIEILLRNRFYLGEIKFPKNKDGTPGGWFSSNAHQALIDTTIFNKVQKALQTRNQSVQYEDKAFYPYRGVIRCSCGRGYSPYTQKGMVYYRSRCASSCENTDPNLSEENVETSVQDLMDSISFTDEELAEIEARAPKELEDISTIRNRKFDDLRTKQRRIAADLDYLKENRVMLMRTGSMGAEDIRTECERLESHLEAIQHEIRSYAESAKDMLRYILTFSELAKNASLYYRHALDSEKREIALLVFSELTFEDRHLINYRAKDGFNALLERNGNSGAQERT
ncbi:hypothetical protein BH11PAT2_BH11PAT2_09070 [soil metagenome]